MSTEFQRTTCSFRETLNKAISAPSWIVSYFLKAYLLGAFSNRHPEVAKIAESARRFYERPSIWRVAKQGGISIVELLVVMALASMLAVLSFPPVASMLGAMEVSKTSNLVSDLVARAQQEAVSGRAYGAFVFSSGSHSEGVRMTVFRGGRDGDGNIQWRQIVPWMEVNKGVAVEAVSSLGSAGFFPLEEGGSSFASLCESVASRGVESGYFCLFSPNGAVVAPGEGNLALTVKPRPPRKAGGHFVLLLQKETGRMKVVEN